MRSLDQKTDVGNPGVPFFFLLQDVAEKPLTVQLVEMIRQKTLGKVHLYKQMEIGGKTLGVYIPYGSEEMGQNNDPLSSQAVF